MNRPHTLLVAPTGWSLDSLPAADTFTLEYRFVGDLPENGSASRLESVAPNREIVAVAAHCAAYRGGFGQHALNHHFSRLLLRLRPRLAVVVGFKGCTVDLLHVSGLLQVPTALILDEPAEALADLDGMTCHWLRTALARPLCIVSADDRAINEWRGDWLSGRTLQALGDLADIVASPPGQPPNFAEHEYSIYEFCQRDPTLLASMQQGDVRHFRDCNRVLDVACGAGIFLDCLQREGIAAQGVERDARIAAYAGARGLDVVQADAMEYLAGTTNLFDGIYCSHFVEHLPVDALGRLLRLVESRLAAGGVLVLVFPDPESIRAQLLGFWRDPEHVRFYHAQLVSLMASTLGLELEWSSYDDQPHRVVPFPERPSPLARGGRFPLLPAGARDDQPGLVEKLLGRFGLATERRMRALEQRLLDWSEELARHSQTSMESVTQLEQRTNTLWDVNQTWAWNDNVTLRFRKRVDR